MEPLWKFDPCTKGQWLLVILISIWIIVWILCNWIILLLMTQGRICYVLHFYQSMLTLLVPCHFTPLLWHPPPPCTRLILVSTLGVFIRPQWTVRYPQSFYIFTMQVDLACPLGIVWMTVHSDFITVCLMLVFSTWRIANICVCNAGSLAKDQRQQTLFDAKWWKSECFISCDSWISNPEFSVSFQVDATHTPSSCVSPMPFMRSKHLLATC